MQEKEITVKDLAQKLNVTSETIRSDLDFLAAQGQLVKSHGWARLPRIMKEMPLSIRQDDNLSVKQRVMKKAVEFIEDGMTVYLDPGSTVLAGMEYLRAKKNLTLVVNSTQAALKAVQLGFRVIFLGGLMDENGIRTTGYFAQEMAEKLQIDLAVMGVCGVVKDRGFGIYWEEEMGLRRTLLSVSRKRIAVMDSSKLSTPANFVFASFEEIDAVVCDGLSEDQKASLAKVRELVEVN